MKNCLVYVAGPYTKPDPCQTTHNAIKVGNELLNAGYPSFVPHITHFWHTMHPQPYETWLALDIVIMERCDVVLRLPGYSSGADKEVIRAKELGIPVVIASSLESAACDFFSWVNANAPESERHRSPVKSAAAPCATISDDWNRQDFAIRGDR